MIDTSRIMAQGHSHAEQWDLQPGLAPDARVFAHEMLPVLRSTKAALIELGGLTLTATLPSDLDRASATAVRLMRIAERAHATSAPRAPAGTACVAQEGMRAALQGIASWAAAVVEAGGHVSAECAAGLAAGYRELRGAAELLWQLELVPEGRGEGGP
jgi:hypothetical protein